MIKEELKNYLKMNIELTRLEDKIARIRNKVESPKTAMLTNDGKGGERKDFTDCVDELIELQESYDKRAKAIIAEQIHIENAIAALADPIERAVLGYKYIDGLNWEQICVKISYSWRNTHYIHAKALENIKES